jgi:type I restriction enzyme S subunit
MLKEKMLVPQLRFSEFEGEWGEKKLENVCSFFSGGTPTSTKREYYTGNIPFIGSGNIFDSSVEKYISEKAFKNSSAKIVGVGDILYALYGANSGDVAISKLYGAINQAILCIRTEEEKKFLYQVLTHKKESIVRTYLQGGQGNLSAKIVKKIKIRFPKKEEQQKIANFLSAIDKRIQTLVKKKTLLEQYKKGVMQKIFKQELRFKDDTSTSLSASDGKAFPEWEEKKLGDFLSLPKKETPEFIDIAKILTVKLNLKGVFLNNRTDGLKIGATKYIIRKKGQFIYGKQNLFNGAFAIIPDKFDGFVSSGDVPSLDIDSNQLDSKFLYFFLARTSFYKKLENIASGSGSKRIHEKTLFKVEIGLPSLKEQTKIANFLSTVDKNIALVSKKIEHTKTYKKGLMQQMFV